jgi:tRNA G18 (ribose-2'-O)-methylase SpoU
VADVVPVDDPDDARVCDYVGLTDAELRRRGEVFVCEGILVLRRAVDAGASLRSVLVTPQRLAAAIEVVGALDVPVYVAEQAVMNRVVGFDIHRGVVAAALRPRSRPLGDILAGSRTVAVLEAVNDLENLGALFRNAAAFAVDAVLLDPTCADPLYRRSVRVSLGHVTAVPSHRLTSWPADLDRVRRAGFTIVALTPNPTAAPVETIEQDERVALLLGAEGPGLSSAALATADRHVRIPMADGIDSLNVATAAAVAFHRRFR